MRRHGCSPRSRTGHTRAHRMTYGSIAPTPRTQWHLLLPFARACSYSAAVSRGTLTLTVAADVSLLDSDALTAAKTKLAAASRLPAEMLQLRLVPGSAVPTALAARLSTALRARRCKLGTA